MQAPLVDSLPIDKLAVMPIGHCSNFNSKCPSEVTLAIGIATTCICSYQIYTTKQGRDAAKLTVAYNENQLPVSYHRAIFRLAHFLKVLNISVSGY
jgi:hypothetical protein